MINKVKSHIKNGENFDTNSQIELENFRIKYLGKKGIITDLFKSLNPKYIVTYLGGNDLTLNYSSEKISQKITVVN